jgi:hypothetical protein
VPVSRSSSSGRHRLTLLLAALVALLLVTASQAAEAEYVSLTIEFGGETAAGEVECKVGTGPIEPCEFEYPSGRTLTLVPIAEEGSVFAGFENGTGSATACTGGASTCKFKITTESSVEALFDEVPKYALTVNVEGEGAVECKVGAGPVEFCEPEYPSGTELTLMPLAEPGSVFAGFENGTGSAEACTSANPCTFAIDSESTVTATFELEPPPPPPSPSPTSPPPTSPSPSPLPTSPSPLQTPSPATPAGEATVPGIVRVKGAAALVKVSCKGPGPCEGALKLLAKLRVGKGKGKGVAIGSASFNLAPGASETLRVRLSRRGKQLLKSGRALKASVTGSGIEPRIVELR